jgi:hypothetical protein
MALSIQFLNHRISQLHNLYSSPDIIRVIKQRKLEWLRHHFDKYNNIRTIYWLEILKNLQNYFGDGDVEVKGIFFPQSYGK